jgi:hypothetical protein
MKVFQFQAILARFHGKGNKKEILSTWKLITEKDDEKS